MSSKVSIIMPVYNAERYLKDALNSVVSQTYENIEIICVNDGSTDQSGKILNDYRQMDNRISVITTENHGAGSARNTALKAATGDWLAFVDADDMMTPFELEYALTVAEKYNLDVVTFQFRQMEKDQQQITIDRIHEENIQITDPQEIENVFYMLIGFVTTKLFRREYIQKNKIIFQEIPFRNDAFFCFAACLLADRIAIIEEPLYVYRTHSDSISHQTNTSLDSVYTCLSGIQNFLREKGLYEIYERRFVNWALEHLICHSACFVSPSHYPDIVRELQDCKLKELTLVGLEKSIYEPNLYVILNSFYNFHPEKTGEIHRLFIENSMYLRPKLLETENKLSVAENKLSTLEIQYINKCEEFNCISNASFWRMTKPLRRFCDKLKMLLRSNS